MNRYIYHLRLLHADFVCIDCKSSFCATTSRALDMSHREPGVKGGALRDTGTSKHNYGGFDRMALYLPVADFTREVFEACDVRCVPCHRLKDHYINDQGTVKLADDLRWTRQQQRYAEWRTGTCQYGTDPKRDHGREWTDGQEPALSCLFGSDGTVDGWPAVRRAFVKRCDGKVPRLVMTACFMEGDHVGEVPVKNEKLRAREVGNVYTLPPEEFEAELKNMRRLCFACHRWVTHGPPLPWEGKTNGEVYQQLVQGLGDPLKDRQALRDFELAGRDWLSFMRRRAEGN